MDSKSECIATMCPDHIDRRAAGLCSPTVAMDHLPASCAVVLRHRALSITWCNLCVRGESRGDFRPANVSRFTASASDSVAAAQILRDDEAIDNEFEAFVRRLIASKTKDPRTIPMALDYLSIARAIERIGDHATNIAEFVVYVVKGTDVRHPPREQIERC